MSLDIHALMVDIHQTAKEKGWWRDCERTITGGIDENDIGYTLETPEIHFDPTKRNVGETFLLMTSEIAEAFEEVRSGIDPREIYFKQGAPTKPEGVPIELADCIIRILDYCHANKIDIERALLIKTAYNKTRPYRHGGKTA